MWPRICWASTTGARSPRPPSTTPRHRDRRVSVKTEMLFPCPGYAEKDMDELWAANARVISEVMAKARIDARRDRCRRRDRPRQWPLPRRCQGKPVAKRDQFRGFPGPPIVEQWYADGTCDRVFPGHASPSGQLSRLRSSPGFARTGLIFLRGRGGSSCARITSATVSPASYAPS